MNDQTTHSHRFQAQPTASRLRRTLLAALAGGALCFSVGCASSSEAERGAGTGALIGGALGAIIGHQSGHTGEGAAIGAAVGGGVGYAAGNEEDKRRNNRYHY